MLDLSGFGEKSKTEWAVIDRIANVPFLDQMKEELSNARFRSLSLSDILQTDAIDLCSLCYVH